MLQFGAPCDDVVPSAIIAPHGNDDKVLCSNDCTQTFAPSAVSAKAAQEPLIFAAQAKAVWWIAQAGVAGPVLVAASIAAMGKLSF